MAWGLLGYKVMELLKTEFQPQDRYSRVEVKRKLYKVSMKANDDPRVLFKKLATVKNLSSIKLNSVSFDCVIQTLCLLSIN